ncbi:MAG: right-handed parallel beta-helix repeat-containing protein [Planctomycetota bacterium]
MAVSRARTAWVNRGLCERGSKCFRPANFWSRPWCWSSAIRRFSPSRSLALFVVVLLVFFSSWAHAEPDTSIEAGKTPSRTIEWTDREGVRIDAVQIDASPSIVLIRCRDVVISASVLRDIMLADCQNVVVIDNRIRDSPRVGVALDDCDDVRINGNRFSRVASGVYAHNSRGVRVIRNSADDVQGPMPRGQLVQFDKVTGPGNEIAYNVARNRRGTSQPEDAINLFQSHGTPDQPIDVHHNLLMGDPTHGSDGKSDSGSGIMLGDGGGSHQIARNNVLISPGQVGIGVAGGEEIAVIENRVVGRASDVSNVGIYAWNQYDQPGGRVIIARNDVHWTNAQGKPNDIWFGDGFREIRDEGNRSRAIDLLDEPALIQAWKRSVQADR